VGLAVGCVFGPRRTHHRSCAEPPLQAATVIRPTSSVSYYVRQYSGLILGSLSCLATWWTYDQTDPNMTLKMLAWLLLCVIGLGIHELRPYKVRGGMHSQLPRLRSRDPAASIYESCPHRTELNCLPFRFPFLPGQRMNYGDALGEEQGN
jgi:hypothetical protein